MEYSIISNIGNREQNEDFADGIISQSGTEGFFILADGLGGHGKGEIASHSVVSSCIRFFHESLKENGFIEDAILTAQKELIEKQCADKAKNTMRTTIVTLLIKEKTLYWGHVGDSRLYYFKKKKLLGRTIDHSVPQMLALSGEIKEKDIRNHPDRDKLLRVMGSEWEREQYEVSQEIVRTGDEAFLLCSDGFWENITEKEMQRCLKRSKSSVQWLESMNDIVQRHGKKKDMDNNTAIVVFV